ADAGPSYVTSSPEQVAASVKQWSTPPLPGSGSNLVSAGKRIDPRNLRIAVQNGGAGVGAANRGTAVLRSRGYDATSDGDAAADLTGHTALYFRGDQQRAARQLTGALAGSVGAELAPPDQPKAQPLILVVGPGFPTGQPLKPPAHKRTAKSAGPSVTT